MTRSQWRSLKILFAYFLWLCDFIVWGNGWFDDTPQMHEVSEYWLIFYFGVLMIVAVVQG